MTFAGMFPYGAGAGAASPADTTGAITIAGGGEGVEFYLTIDPPFSIRSIVSFTEIGRILPPSGAGAIPVSGGGGLATIILSKAGTPIDTGMGTLNFNPGSDNSFLITDTPAGTGNIALNFAGLAGLFGSVYQPARSDHKHTTGGVISGYLVEPYPAVTISSSLSSVNSLTIGPGVNGIRYDILGFWMCQGGVTTGDQIDAFVGVAGASSVIGSGTQTANGERPLFAFNHVDNVLADGVTTYNILGKAKIATSGLGAINSGILIGIMVPRS